MDGVDATTVATILGSIGFSGMTVAIINFYANRKKVGADATKIITEAAASVVSSLRGQVDDLRAREDERDERDEQRDQEMEELERRYRRREREWASRLEELEDRHHKEELARRKALDKHGEWDTLATKSLNEVIPPINLPPPPPLYPTEGD